MQNCTGCLAWAWFSSSIWPPNFIKHLHYSSSGAPNPVLWDMANRFAAAGPGTTCHQPGAFVKRPQVDQVEPELFQPLDGWRFWPCKSSWKIPCFIFEVWCRSRHYGSSVWHDNLTPPLLQRIVGQIQAFQVSASLQSCLFWKTAGIKVIAPVPIGVHQKQEIVTTEDQLTHITHIINIPIINSCGIRIAHTFGMTNAPYVAKSSLDGKDLVLWDLMVAETVFFTCMEILLSVNTLSSISVSEWLSSHNHLLGVLFEHLLMESPRARSAILIHCPPMQSPSLLSPSGDLMTDLSKLSTVVQYQR